MNIVKNILWQFFVLAVCTGSVASVLLGVTLLLKPDIIERLNQYLARWVSPEKVSEQLDRPRWIERYFYRHHRLVGSVLLIGAGFVLYIFLFRYSAQKVVGMIPHRYLGFYELLVTLLQVGSTLAALVGIIVLIRPSMLRTIEKASNHWISTGPAVRFFDGMHHSVDRLVLQHRKVAGGIMIVGGLFIIISLAPLLWRSGLGF